MTSDIAELLVVADRLGGLAREAEAENVAGPLHLIESAAEMVGKAWSGSWLGYQACVYYRDLEPPPPGAHFSSEWGFFDTVGPFGTSGDWHEYASEYVKKAVCDRSGNPDLTPAEDLAERCRLAFEEAHPVVSSILETAAAGSGDSYLARLREEVAGASVLSASDVERTHEPSGQQVSRDSLAVTQGFRIPPHISVIAHTRALRGVPMVCGQLAAVARNAASHLERKQRSSLRSERIGTNVFIGHGRSRVWKDLKDFVQDRLRLPWDEFNRVPVAGITNTQRLSEMLDAAAVAFLVMTAEDEQVDGAWHARMNVVHEAGLFQGRLGFTRAIVLLEEGCEEFSNIQGLGRIHFPRGNIAAAFEEIRLVLEREDLITFGDQPQDA